MRLNKFLDLNLVVLLPVAAGLAAQVKLKQFMPSAIISPKRLG